MESSKQSAKREIGTQVSVLMTRQPGRLFKPAKYVLCLAVHKRVRSSGVVAHSKAWPPNSEEISCTVSACSLTLAGEPWNSMSNMGCTGRLTLE